MKSIVIYNPNWPTMGGGEKYLATLAEVLAGSGTYRVSLLSDSPSVTLDPLRRYFNLPLAGVSLRTCTAGDVKRILGEADIGVVLATYRPYGSPARRNVYVLQVPYARITWFSIARKVARGEFKEGMKDLSRSALMRQARAADLVLVYSCFTHDVFNEQYSLTGEILYPPIDGFESAVEKKPFVLSVGRLFRGLYNDKRYDVMIPVFRELCDRLPLSGLEYHIAGSCSDDEASRGYLASLREAARGYPVYFHVNCPYEELRRLYAEATLFWHAAGYGVDEKAHPDRMEHFGMSTVEAMSAGCIAVVINKGGQKEIVSHGESGYLWDTPGELLAFSRELLTTPMLVSSVREAGLHRSRMFDREHFAERCLSLFQQLD